jgi:hypothetical protein
MFIRFQTFLLICLYMLIAFSTSAKKTTSNEDVVKKGDVVVSMGVGIPSFARSYLRYKTSREEYTITGIGPLYLKGDYMLNNKFSVGLNLFVSKSKIYWFQSDYDTILNAYRDFEFGTQAFEFSANLRTNYHFWRRGNIDSYVGIGAGYGYIRIWLYSLAHTTVFNSDYEFPPPVSMEATWGLRYFPRKNLGFHTEVGLGKSWILFDKYFLPEAIVQLGVQIKL